MTVMQYIDEFVRKAELRVPLYTNEIYEYVKTKLPDTDKATFNMTLQRYEKRNPDFVRYQKVFTTKRCIRLSALRESTQPSLLKERIL